MKTLYENYEDLKEWALKLGFRCTFFSNNVVLVYTSSGNIFYTRKSEGWELKK